MVAAALVVIDMQNDFLASWEAGARALLVAAVNELVAFARASAWPVIWVRQEFAPDLSDALREIRLKRIAVAVRGTPGAELDAGLAVEPADFTIVKKRYSAFYNTELDALLARLAPERLVFAGVNTHACVRCSVIDAYQRDYDLIVARDAVGSHDREHHDVSLRYFDGKIARVLGNPEIMA